MEKLTKSILIILQLGVIVMTIFMKIFSNLVGKFSGAIETSDPNGNGNENNGKDTV